MDFDSLIRAAMDITRNSYAPYSKFRVGAALLTRSGKMFRGVNVENRSYGATICAERTAVSSAVIEGELDFLAIAIYSPDSEDYLPPCGICRQVLSEFPNSGDMEVIICRGDGQFKVFRLSELYPFDALHELSDK